MPRHGGSAVKHANVCHMYPSAQNGPATVKPQGSPPPPAAAAPALNRLWFAPLQPPMPRPHCLGTAQHIAPQSAACPCSWLAWSRGGCGTSQRLSLWAARLLRKPAEHCTTNDATAILQPAAIQLISTADTAHPVHRTAKMLMSALSMQHRAPAQHSPGAINGLLDAGVLIEPLYYLRG